MFSSIFNTCLRCDRYPSKSTLKLVHLFLSFSFSKYIHCLAYKILAVVIYTCRTFLMAMFDPSFTYVKS